jgi:hypothetical protein
MVSASPLKGTTTMSTEIHFFPNPALAGGQFVAQVQDNAGAPIDVIEASLPFTVSSNWNIDVVTAALLGGTWHVDVYVESIGGGFEGRLAGDFVNVVPGQTNYALNIVVAAGTFPNDPPVHPITDNSRVYKMAVVLTHHNGAVTTSICALQEGPAVLVR